MADKSKRPVCYVDGKGQLVCPPKPSTLRTYSAQQEEMASALMSGMVEGEGHTGGISREYLELALALLETVARNRRNVPPEKLHERRDEIVQSVELLLQEGAPPSLLAYRFSTEPADVLGAYFLNKANLVQMRNALEEFDRPKLSGS